MGARAARLTFGAMAWLVIAAAALLLFQSEKQISAQRAFVRDFDLRAHATSLSRRERAQA